MDKKCGVYICTGCGIGKALDIERLSKLPGKEYNVEVCKTHEFCCGPEGVEQIKKDINGEGVNTIVVAGCSMRVNQDVFDFGPDKIVERVNLREQVVWCQEPAKEKTETEEEIREGVDLHIQFLAEDYLRMGIVRAQKSELPEPYMLESLSKRILVMGGGVTGLTAAVEAAKAGYDVTIAEKGPSFGGYAGKLRKQVAASHPYADLEEPIVQDIITAAQSNPKIELKTNTVVARIAGQPGEFTVTFKKPGEEIEFDVPQIVEQTHDEEGKELTKEQIDEIYAELNKGRADILTLDPDGQKFGAVVLATGWKPYDASEFANLGFGKYKNVITNAMMEEIAAKGNIVRPSDGKEAKSVVFIQNPKKGDDSDFPFGSSVTSLVALKQAKYVREDDSEAKAYIIYQHMRTPGLYENFYKNMQDDDGIFMTKGSVASIAEGADGNLLVEVEDNLIGETIKIDADMIVLAAGMVPTTKDDPVVNLAYRQGPGFRDIGLFDGYADSNFICFPYETQRTGIYAAGCVRQALTIGECIEDATGAALKAIQCIDSVNRGVSVHPRSGDMTFPDFFFSRCTQCKRCTEECPFGALDDDEKGTPKPNPARCRRCGTCMGACPERIIGFADYNIDMIGSMIKAIEVPTDDDYDPVPLRVVVLVCENDAYPAVDMAGMNGLKYSPMVRFIPVRCLGSVNTVWIKDALSSGLDGVLLLGCQYGDDYQCHFIKGSELCNRRMENVAETLKSLALESERVELQQVAINEYDKIPGIINKFMETIDEVGPNPFKGF
jgi:quinone-modifying oxidoreductase subunit QmoB